MPPTCLQFQSTPDLINRENNRDVLTTGFDAPFQSTPDLINRENVVGGESVAKAINVSIHSRFN